MEEISLDEQMEELQRRGEVVVEVKLHDRDDSKFQLRELYLKVRAHLREGLRLLRRRLLLNESILLLLSHFQLQLLGRRQLFWWGFVLLGLLGFLLSWCCAASFLGY